MMNNENMFIGIVPLCTTEKSYTQYYEWLDGNPNNEDRRGHFVTFATGNKIRISNSEDDYILGVCSVETNATGNAYTSNWQGKYLTDPFDERLIEVIEVPETTNKELGITIPAHEEKRYIINPNYDETEQYIGRNKRQEWAVIGTHGQLVVIDDGTCKVNHYCAVSENGIATKSDVKTEYRVIERIDENHIRIVIK